jgi:hypothetical protein
MEKTIYVVSYTSYHDEIYNNVIAFDDIESAIDSANNYLTDARLEVRGDINFDKDFTHYNGGYKEIEVDDKFSPTTFLISISEFIFNN